jgi:hypothetical protein
MTAMPDQTILERIQARAGSVGTGAYVGLLSLVVLAASGGIGLLLATPWQALKVPHPPAGATTLIISLGVIATPVGILTMAAAIAFTIVACWGVNRLLGERPAEAGE